MIYSVAAGERTQERFIVEAHGYRVIEGDLIFFNEDDDDEDLVMAFAKGYWKTFKPKDM